MGPLEPISIHRLIHSCLSQSLNWSSTKPAVWDTMGESATITMVCKLSPLTISTTVWLHHLNSNETSGEKS